MKNLNLLYSRNKSTDLTDVTFVVPNSDQPNISYIFTSDSLQILDWDTQKITGNTSIEGVIGCEHLALNNEICLATSAGEVIVVNPLTNAQESVTFCDGGIETMAWSPDQEVVAFVTKEKNLVVLNSAYDPLAEHNLDDEAFGEEEFINVGWGKKETQFHGTEGKQAAKKKAEIIVVDDSEALDAKISIIWRGDGEYFAVSFVGRWGRMFKVYDKEGKLKYTSEKCTGLEAPIYWRPSGNWIAIPQILPNKYTIALFEKNGLRHREIVLPFKADEEKVTRLLWSSDSDVLVIETIRDEKSNVYLYTVCNYHWYLKQSLVFDGKLQALLWHPSYSEGKSLHAIDSNGNYLVYRWIYSVNHSSGLSKLDQSVVAVIDNSNVLLTNFRGAVVPPPMSSAILNHPNKINSVGFLKYPRDAQNTNKFFVVDSQNQFTTHECHFECDEIRNINLLNKASPTRTYSLKVNSQTPLFFHHWVWLTDDQVIFCCNNEMETLLYLCELSHEDNLLNVIDILTIADTIVNVACASSHNIIFQLKDGSVQTTKIESGKFNPAEELYSLTSLCEKLEARQEADGEIKVIALKSQQNLYLNDKKIASEVSSFQVTEKFILFTTLDQLKFVRLDNGQIINERRIERGGKLVVVVPNDSRTVYQLPRGNLEAIQPRVLSLCIIGDLLDTGEYRKAFDLLRKQRINLNLMVDHDPVKFLANIDHFVEDIQNTNWLNLFLSDLQNDDVTVTMYSSNYQQRASKCAECFKGNKIDAVCSRICEVFLAKGISQYLLPVVTTHVKRLNLEEALRIIWDVKLSENEGAPNDVNVAKTAVTSQEALKYLLYLVNVSELYDVALGLYDFSLVLFVAQRSQKDPKEYIPFLNELKGFEENYRKFKIDHYLKRYEKALEHIVKCGVEKLDECLELISTHGLHTNALRLFKKTDECYKEVVLQFADHLRSKGQLFDACLMYERAEDFKQALLSAKHILDWRKCDLLARKLSYTNDEIQQLCVSLIPGLQENGKYLDAAEIVRKYQNDIPLVLKILCEGRHYEEAIHEARNGPEYIDHYVKGHLTCYSAQLTTRLETDTTQFKSYTQRLQTIRKEKSDKLLNGIEDDADDCDMFSDTSSMNSSRLSGTSRGSGKSHRSSKNRRKHERKLLSLKEGNPFEDIALVDALYNLTHKSFELQSHVRSILRVLIDMELDVEGVLLQKTYDALLTNIKESLGVIWIPEMMVSGEVKPEEIMDYVKAQNEQHYAMIKPHQRCKPLLNTIEWQFEVLK